MRVRMNCSAHKAESAPLQREPLQHQTKLTTPNIITKRPPRYLKALGAETAICDPGAVGVLSAVHHCVKRSPKAQQAVMQCVYSFLVLNPNGRQLDTRF